MTGHQDDAAPEQVLPPDEHAQLLQEVDGAQAAQRLVRHVHDHVVDQELDQLHLREWV